MSEEVSDNKDGAKVEDNASKKELIFNRRI